MKEQFNQILEKSLLSMSKELDKELRKLIKQSKQLQNEKTIFNDDVNLDSNYIM